MTFSKIAFAALALAVSSAPAFASDNARDTKLNRMQSAMERTTAAPKTTIFGLPASQPTIWGHPVQDRTAHDMGREVTGG